MSGGIPWITLPAGYLGSSLIGAALIACGFNTNASKIASLAMAAFFLVTLWWARKSWVWVHFPYISSCTSRVRGGMVLIQIWMCRTWLLILGMSGLIVLFWFVGEGVALRYFVSPVGDCPGGSLTSLTLTSVLGPVHRCHV